MTWSLPKIYKHIARKLPSIDVAYRPIKHLPTIRKIPGELWNEIKLLLPSEKPNDTIGRPVLDGIVCVLRTGCQWKMLPREYGSGSTTGHRRFQEWIVSDVFRKLWVRLDYRKFMMILKVLNGSGNQSIVCK